MGIGSLAASVGGYLTDKVGVSNVFALLGLISIISLLLVFYILKAAASQALALEVATENPGRKER